MLEIAKIQSTGASNRIEGIYTSEERLAALVKSKAEPRNRSEQEIAGYREVLSLIHDSYDYMVPRTNVILQLHRDLYQFSPASYGGSFKNSDNVIAEIDSSGQSRVRFQPLSAFETPDAVERLTNTFVEAVRTEKYDPLLLVPLFILDFLCIHPFNDGNGRMSRLLTTLLLYQSGFVVGRYISLEAKIEKTKDVYYDVLQSASVGWHEEMNDPTPLIKYLLGTILSAYRDFEDRVNLGDGKLPAVEQVRQAVKMKIGKFTKSEIMELCPGIGKTSVENSLKALVEDSFITPHGQGKATYYTRNK